MRSELWNDPESYSLTEHQERLTSRLSPGKDICIIGDIGAGKTFSVRHYLRDNNIGFAYFTASELYRQSNDVADRVNESIDVVVIDNFDVIPERRSYLESIHETIELDLAAVDRSVWLILPTWYQNDWFETVIEGMERIKITNSQINRLTVDHVVKNLNKIHDSSGVKLDPGSIATGYGYHTIVSEFEENLE